MASSPTTAKVDKAEEWKWKVEDAARTLMAFEKIRSDPKLLAAAKAELKKQRKEIDRAVNAEPAAAVRKE